MKTLLCILTSLVITSKAISQDSLQTVRNLDTLTVPDSLDSSFRDMLKYIDCNHGHICCFADCICCELWGLPEDFEILTEDSVSTIDSATIEKVEDISNDSLELNDLILPPIMDCAHGHLCCLVACYCCPNGAPDGVSISVPIERKLKKRKKKKQ